MPQRTHANSPCTLPLRNGHRTAVKRWLLSIGAAITIMLVPALTVGPAHASPSDFTSQARAAGLTATQADALQEAVDRYVAQTGGTQVSANQIDLRGATLSVPVPGEARPRTFGTSDVHCNSGADYEYFCAYSETYFNGTSIAWWACGVEKYIPWNWEGSWDNNQTPGTRARIYYLHHSALTPPAPSRKLYGEDWANVRSIKGC
ncbi:hypothetical protein HLK59_39275 [Streptomyces sp. S3(2020)]|uniref:hypothetical protein n=1 Tax=Streptomyces sp. S3(2020) TaxID=2732044 RepID=UPI001489E33D|nr:hypothetical protein [Streptomyces sp. S3(2020)]NNN36300.1 hypothetical protein [Streptomyces sp. S3(2020)]